VTEKIYRSYLEIRYLGELKEVKKPAENYFVELADPKDFQLNKFFTKLLVRIVNGLIDLFGQT